MTGQSVAVAARTVLMTPEPQAKADQARAVAALWRAGALSPPDPANDAPAPDRPARPDKPMLVPPGQVPRRRLSNPEGRAALLHAVAHIEFNAIDLAFDLVCRFGADPDVSEQDRTAFLSDWISVGDDEARHFLLVCDRLDALDSVYGDLPAHDGLWEAALATSDDLGARLAIAPLVLEARGLDVTPGMIDRLRKAGDEKSAAALQIIYDDEIGHVAAGARWFRHLCENRSVNPEDAFKLFLASKFSGILKPPFNHNARTMAGVPKAWYE